MRTKVLLVVGITLVVMLTLITAITRTILMGDYSRLERQAVEKDLLRVQNGLSEDMEALRATAGDYAVWDDSYAFVAGQAPEYVEENLQEDTLLNLSLDYIVFLDGSGGTVLAMAAGDGGARNTVRALGIAAELSTHNALTRTDMDRAGACGVLPLPDGLSLAASHPIVPNREDGPPRGVLIVGRMLDDAYAARKSESLGVRFSLLPPDADRMPEDAARLRGRLAAADGSPVVEPIDGKFVGGYAVLRDVDGAEAAVLRTETPRDIHDQELLSLRWFTFWIVLVGLVFLVAVIGFLETVVLSRLQAMGRAVDAVETSGDASLRVPVRGLDELSALGLSINGMLDALERSSAALRRSEQRHRAFLDAIPDMIFSCSPEGTIRDIRMPAVSRFDMPPGSIVGRNARELHRIYPVVPASMVEGCLQAADRLRAGGPPQVLAFKIPHQGAFRDVEVRITVSAEGEAFFLVRDVTSQKTAEESERNRLLLKEIHHRVKNNLQVISSLLALQAGASRNEEVRTQLRESTNRVKSMALIHEKLYQAGASRKIDFTAYLRDLVAQLRQSYAERSERVRVDTDLQECELDMELAVPCGMIVNELLTNSLKHGFPGGRAGTVVVALRREDGTFGLRVSDDGVGIPEGLDRENPSTLGLRILRMLVLQIRGTMEVRTDGGTSSLVRFRDA